MEEEKVLTAERRNADNYEDEKYVKIQTSALEAAFLAMDDAIAKTYELADADFPRIPRLAPEGRGIPKGSKARKLEKITKEALTQTKCQRKWDLKGYGRVLATEEKLVEKDPERPSAAIQIDFLNASAKQRTLAFYEVLIVALKERHAVMTAELRNECNHPYVVKEEDGDYHRTTEWHKCISCGKKSLDRDGRHHWKDSKELNRIY